MENERAEPKEAEWDDKVPKDTWGNYSATGRLSVVLAGVTFSVLFFPFSDTPWGLKVATLTAYSVLIFSLAFRDSNCSLRKSQVRDQLAKFAFMHVPFLLLVYGIEAEWLNLASSMPSWLTVRGRKGSFYEWFLITALCLIAWWQEHWMRAIVRRKLRSEGPV
jgi:hypothetical protein